MKKKDLLHVMTARDFAQKVFSLIFNVLKTEIDGANGLLLLCQTVPELAFVLVDVAIDILEEGEKSVSCLDTFRQLLLERRVDFLIL